MKKVKIINFTESRLTGLSTSNAIERNPQALYDNGFQVLYITFSLKYMKKVKRMNFNEEWLNRIKQIKCYRMKSISPVLLWILNALYYFKPQIHEKSEHYQFE